MEWASPLLERYLFPIRAEETPAPAFLAGVAHAASNLWGDLNKPRECSKFIAQVISFGDSDAINAIRQLFWNEIPLPADEQTSAILEKLTMRMEVVSGELAGDVLGQLTNILPYLRPEILAFAERFVETRFEELRSREFNVYEVGPYLVEIAMTLQRFVDTRSDGLNLFESLLRAGLDEANKALQDVDAVNEVDPQSPGRPSLRRRKRKE